MTVAAQLGRSELSESISRASDLVVPKDYVPSAESAHSLYQLELETAGFEGPLDLLLLLIKRHQLDIFDIPMAFICARYLDALEQMEELNLDVAAEFMFMASELVHIKSRMLMPKPDEAEAAEEEDPRAALVARLLEYQKYRDAAALLNAQIMMGRDTFVRKAASLPRNDEPKALRETNVLALTRALSAMLKKQKPEIRHKVVVEQVSIRRRMQRLIDVLLEQETLSFVKLLEGLYTRLDVVMTFLAILEMTRLQLLKLYESDDGQLYLHPRFAERAQAMQRVNALEEAQYAG